MADMSPADFAAVSHPYGYGMGFGGDSWAWIIVLLFALGGGGFGFGRNGYDSNVARIQDVYASNDLQGIRSGINNLGNGIADATFALNNTTLTQSNLLQRDILNGFCNTTNQGLQNTYAISSAIAENRFAAKESSCTTNRNIDAVRYENAQNTCAITRAIEQDGEKTRALIVQNKIEELQGKIAEKNLMLQNAHFELSQQAQNSTLIKELKPCPIPAYNVPNPYCNCGCPGQFA